jgi:hypothetical protein
MTARTDPTPLADVPGGSAADAQKASADDDAHTRAPVEEQPEAAETAAKTKKAKKPGKAQKAAEKAQRAEGKADTGEQPEAGKHEDAEAQPERPDRSAPTDREEPQDQPRPGEHGGTIEPGPVPQLAPPSVEAHYDPPPWRVMPPPVVPAQAARLSGPQAPEPQQPAPGPSAETHVPAVAAPPPRPPHVPRRPATPGELDRIAAQLAPTMPPGADQPPDDDVPVHRIPAARPAAHRDAMSLLSSLYDVGEPEAPARPTPPAPPPRPARGEPVWQAVVAPEGEAMDRTDVLSQLHFLGDESPSGSEPESDSESQAKGPGSAKPKRRGFFGR